MAVMPRIPCGFELSESATAGNWPAYFFRKRLCVALQRQFGTTFPHIKIGDQQKQHLPMQICMGKPLANLDFCASRCNLLQCGSDTAALLGRFLPRLGPLA
jgi:hypothetical protein